MPDLKPVQLRCEYLQNPLGVDGAAPRLSWKIESERRGARQTAYEIASAPSETDLARDNFSHTSGRVESDETRFVPYEGAALQSAQRVCWKVRAWDENGELSPWSESAHFETGLLKPADWSAYWISGLPVGGPRTTAPATYLRTSFQTSSPIESARLYVTALGVYEAFLNGARIGEDVFAPGWTDYDKITTYQTYDVTPLLQSGENVLGATVGAGWASGHIAWCDRQLYVENPALLAQLVIRCADGTTQTVVTDDGWKTSFGPIVENDFLAGESYDARRELGNWSFAGYDDAKWQPAEAIEYSTTLVSPIGAPMRVTQELQPISFYINEGWGGHRTTFDFGQNMVGRVRLRVRGEAGQTLRLRYAETLQGGPNAKDGAIYIDNLRSARATDYYTCKGGEEEIWEPSFTFHGFRYVEIEGLKAAPTTETLTGIVIHSVTEKTGDFSCSDELVNQLQRNIDWGWRGNSLDIPTDCPQRDERMGWTGDAQVFARTAAFIRGVDGFFAKWQRDIAFAQFGDGAIPAVVPDKKFLGEMTDGGPAWADAAIICPWTMYRCYGDKAILSRHLETYERFVEYLRSTARDFIRCEEDATYYRGFGDWLSMDSGTSLEGATPKELIGTAFFAYSTQLLASIYRVLDMGEEAVQYEELHANIKSAFIEHFVTPQNTISGDTQTSCVLALHFGLLPENARQTVVLQLVRNIEGRGGKLSTGFVGSPYLNFVLSQNGHENVAFGLLNQQEWPSWLYAVTQGATTIWERWDGWTHDKGFADISMNSYNHYAYGAIGAWLYQFVAGIELDENVAGYKHFLLQPHVGGGLTQASAFLESPHGRIESAWQIENNLWKWNFRVPPNTTATVRVPAASAGQIAVDGNSPETANWTLQSRDENAAFYRVESGTYAVSVALSAAPPTDA